MSLYNMVNGANPATFFILPMLGKHADDYPRFRDCFVEEREFTFEDGLPTMRPKADGLKEPVICVFTRVGGGNREEYADDIEELQQSDEYITDYDDDFDSTYATFVFRVPEQWKEDYRKIVEGSIKNISEAYKTELYHIYPKLKEQFDTLFSGKPEDDHMVKV